MKKLAIFLVALVLAVPAFAGEVFPHTPTADVDPGAREAEMEALYNWVSSFEGKNKAAAYDVLVPLDKLAALESHQPGGGPLWIGVRTEVGFAYDPAAKAAFGSVSYADGLEVWTGSFRSPGATGVRLHLEGVNLPKGGQIYVFDRHGQAFGPYDGKGTIWTNTVAGEEILLQVHLPLGKAQPAAGKPLFKVAELSHLGDRYRFGFSADKAFCPWNDSCIVNAECAQIPGGVQPTQDAVAYLLFDLPQGTFLCSGGLLNDTANSGTPFLLTANHCFSNQQAASTLEAHFQWTVGCNQSCGTQFFPPGSVPRTVGSTLLATSSNTDFTLVELSQSAPAGSVFLGWTTSPVAFSTGADLFRVSHPSGSPQAYSEQSVNTSSGTCSGLPRGDFIYSDATLGDTEGGSSGSPVVNGSSQVVGQLFGACGFSPSTTCDGDDRTVDGAFAETFPSVAQWLDPGGGPSCSDPGASCSQNSDCCSNKCRGPRNNRTCR